MRKCILFILLMFSINVFAQIRLGEIVYKVELVESKKASTNKEYKSKEVLNFMEQYNLEREKMLPYFSYQLQFNEKEALLTYAESMATDQADVDMKDVAMHIGIYDKFYFNTETDVLLNQRRFFNDELILINSKISQTKWKIHPETKIIAGYTCQKATTNEFDYIDLFDKDKEITVWFAKELPFSVGPGFAGLPGLILGLEIKKFNIYADQINLKKQNTKISAFSKGRKMTDQEFQKELEIQFNKMDEGIWD